MKRRSLILFVLAGLLAAVGLPRLQVDGGAAFRLPSEHPLAQLNRDLVAETGGDDLLAAVVMDHSGDPDGLLDEAGVRVLSDVTAAMEGVASLHRVRSVVSLPLLANRGGTITAETPLSPAPAGEAAWTAARERVLGSPFALHFLVSEDARLAPVLGWLVRGTDRQRLVARAGAAVEEPDFLSSPAGQAVQAQLNEGRLAVALGEADGSLDEELARRLERLAQEGGPGAAEVAAWLQEVASIPAAAAAVQEARQALEAIELPGDTEVVLVGTAVMEDLLSSRVPRDIALALALLSIGLSMVAHRLGARSVQVVGVGLSAPLCLAGLLGGMGILGATLHLYNSILGLGLAAAVGCLCLLSVTPTAGKTPSWTAWEARALAATGLLVIAGLLWFRLPSPDPAGLLAPGHPVARATDLLAQETGTCPLVYLVLDDRKLGLERPLTRPPRLALLRQAQQEAVGGSLLGSVSWADFVADLHQAVSGEEGLPSRQALVDQYLLMFGRPEETRALLSSDQGMGVAMLRVDPVGARRSLNDLAQLFPAGGHGVVAAGAGMEMALASSALWRVLRVLEVGLITLLLLASVLPVHVEFPGSSRAMRMAMVVLCVSAIPLGLSVSGQLRWVGLGTAGACVLAVGLLAAARRLR